MRSALALSKRILQQFSHDPRTVVMFIVAPILVLWLFSVMLGASDYQPRLAGVGLPDELTKVLVEQEAGFEELDAVTAADRLANQELDAVLSLDDGGVLQVRLEGSNASHSGVVMSAVNSAVKEVAASQREQMVAAAEDSLAEVKGVIEGLAATVEAMNAKIQELSAALAASTGAATPPAASPPAAAPAVPGLSDTVKTVQIPEINQTPLISDVAVSYLHGSDEWNGFDFFGPVFIGIFIFVFVFITSGMSLITERTGGTMERLLATPIKPWQLVLGFCLGFGLVSLVQAAIVLWTCITLIGFPNEGSLATVICVTFSLALVSLTLGLMVSGLARTPFQVIQMMLILVVPQILLSGIFDLSQTPEWMQVLSICFPITHGAEALRAIMLRGASLADVAGQLAILWAFIAAFFCLATIGFRRRGTG